MADDLLHLTVDEVTRQPEYSVKPLLTFLGMNFTSVRSILKSSNEISNGVKSGPDNFSGYSYLHSYLSFPLRGESSSDLLQKFLEVERYYQSQ